MYYRGKGCTYRKHLYIYENGKVTYRSANTRSWERAEELANAERNKRDPVKRKLQEIADHEAAKAAEEAARSTAMRVKNITIDNALERWMATHKDVKEGTRNVHKTFIQKVGAWAKRQGILYLRDITSDLLDEWRGQWSKEAEHRYDRMGITTQSHFQTRLKGFFAWATNIRMIDYDPSAALVFIQPSDKRTRVLTPPQFDKLITTIELFTISQTGQVHEYAGELRALFLLQRWVGLRILDCLVFPRSGLVGNRLKLNTQKTGAEVDRILPDHVVTALRSLSPDRPQFKPEYFFWSKTWGSKESLLMSWETFIRGLNGFLSFTDERGQPMRFHSHMLRDTYAVEMLLAGVSLEDVSHLLTHESIQTTERYYAHWVKARRDQLESKALEAMRQQGVTVSL